MSSSDEPQESRILRLLEPQGEPDIIECKTAMESMLGTEAYTAYMQGCAFKYLWRWRDKNGIEDLKKARECIDNVIRAIEGDGQ